MLNLITLSFSLFFICLSGWTFTTYLVKENSQKFIKEDLKNLIEICKMFFVSLKSLIGILAKYSFSSASIKTITTESNELVELPLSFVRPAETVELPVKEDEDNELSSFSPELIEVITEEEEKVA